jgi:hypothetical protein
MLMFPHYDVKNRVDLQFPFDNELTALIDEYVHNYSSILLRGSNDLWLWRQGQVLQIIPGRERRM